MTNLDTSADTSPQPAEAEERNKFEAWMLKVLPCADLNRRKIGVSKGIYTNPVIEWAWRAWLARASSVEN